MKVKELIAQLTKYNPDAYVLVTGLYGSDADDIDVFEMNDEHLKYRGVRPEDADEGVIALSTSLTTG